MSNVVGWTRLVLCCVLLSFKAGTTAGQHVGFSCHRYFGNGTLLGRSVLPVIVLLGHAVLIDHVVTPSLLSAWNLLFLDYIWNLPSHLDLFIGPGAVVPSILSKIWQQSRKTPSELWKFLNDSHLRYHEFNEQGILISNAFFLFLLFSYFKPAIKKIRQAFTNHLFSVASGAAGTSYPHWPPYYTPHKLLKVISLFLSHVLPCRQVPNITLYARGQGFHIQWRWLAILCLCWRLLCNVLFTLRPPLAQCWSQWSAGGLFWRRLLGWHSLSSGHH